MLVSETRSVKNIAGPYLMVILLARTIGYNLFGYEMYAVASSKRFARFITWLMLSSERVWNKAAAEVNKKMTSASNNK